jgi:hypothetical protein
VPSFLVATAKLVMSDHQTRAATQRRPRGNRSAISGCGARRLDSPQNRIGNTPSTRVGAVTGWITRRDLDEFGTSEKGRSLCRAARHLRYRQCHSGWPFLLCIETQPFDMLLSFGCTFETWAVSRYFDGHVGGSSQSLMCSYRIFSSSVAASTFWPASIICSSNATPNRYCPVASQRRPSWR